MVRLRRWPVCTILAGVCLVLGIAGQPRADRGRAESAGREPVVMIGLRVGAPAATIGCRGQVRVWRASTGLRPSLFGPDTEFRVVAAEGAPAIGLSASGVGDLGRFAQELIFEPADPALPLSLDGKAYRGEIIVRPRASRAGLTLVNAVRIEEYLRGVVPAEIGGGAGTPSAALEAQAIAARSYALHYLRRHAGLGFDLLAGPEDQVYGGMAAETARADAAVAATRGLVAVHGGRAIRANYSSTCGGKTSASGEIWPGEAFAYLQTVSDRVGGRDLCRASPYHRWTEIWPRAQFEEQLLEALVREVPAAAARRPQTIRRVEIADRSGCGRVEALDIRTDRGDFRVTGDRIRWVLRRPGGAPLRSTLFARPRLEKKDGGKVVIIEGAGYGHGAGMCQYGALELARQGATAERILSHYYRSIDVVCWW